MAGKRALIIGWSGGVGTALLGLLASHPAGHRIMRSLDALYLLDHAPIGAPPARLAGARLIDAETSGDGGVDAIARVIRDHAIDQVIEVATVDTLALSAVCARVDYVSASIQRVGVDHDNDDGLTMVAASRLLADRPNVYASHLLAAGMNPGIVNALALAGIEHLARRAGVPIPELDLVAIHVTEEDTTACTDGGHGDDVFAMSWSPEHALEEILEPHAMYVSGNRLARLPHRPHDRLYPVRCGGHEIAAMIVPHEDPVSIGARFPQVESAFFYAIPAAARAALSRYPDRRADEWPTHRLYPPHTRRLTGVDRVGALIASRSYGELWIGFEHDAGCARDGWCNATTLQAAAGMLAGWSLLGARTGIHVVDDLDHRTYLAIVEEILGVRRIHYAPNAGPRMIGSLIGQSNDR